MSHLELLLLGIVQGITEFLPVSSSGHLELTEHLLGIQAPLEYLPFVLVCHLGTLLSVLLYYRNDIVGILKGNWKMAFLLVVAILPLFPLYPALSSIKSLFNAPELLGYFFLTTSVLLFIGEYISRKRKDQPAPPPNWKTALGIGCFQALALLPGVSRSGSTISGARIMGWKTADAIRFSFLLSIPTILGGSLHEAKDMLLKNETYASLTFGEYSIGFFSSFIVGLVALKWLSFLAKKESLSIFAWYCLILGLATLYFMH